MGFIVYRKNDLSKLAIVNTIEEIDYDNIIKNHGGSLESYGVIETNNTNYTLKRNETNEVILVEYESTINLDEIRRLRNILLNQCDWIQLQDSPLSLEQVNDWAIYRQALRDFPQNVDLDNIIWPVPPEV